MIAAASCRACDPMRNSAARLLRQGLGGRFVSAMSNSGAVTLRDLDRPMLEVACSRCEQRGRTLDGYKSAGMKIAALV